MRNAFGTGVSDRYGFGVGDYSGGNYLSYNAETSGEFIISAGSGDVTLDSDGLTFDRGTGNASRVKWMDGVTDVAYQYADTLSGNVRWHLYVGAGTGSTVTLDVGHDDGLPMTTDGLDLKIGGTFKFGVSSAKTLVTDDLDIGGSIVASTALGCRVYRSTTQSIATGTDAALSFDTQVHDTDGGFAATDTKLYAKTEGYYIAGGSVKWDDNWDGPALLWIEQNQTTQLARTGHENVWGYMQSFFTVATGMFWMDVDDYIEVYVRQASGSSKNTAAAASTNQANCCAWLTRVA
jgi:hypothetical protein